MPLPTRIVVFISEMFRFIAPLFLVLGVAGGVLWAKFRLDPRVRNVVDPLKLKVPVFGKLFRKVYLARTTRNLSSMLGAGVPDAAGHGRRLGDHRARSSCRVPSDRVSESGPDRRGRSPLRWRGRTSSRR